MSTLRDILFLTKHFRCGQSSQFGALDNLPVSCKSIIFRLKYIRNLFTSIHKVTKDVEMNKGVESLSLRRSQIWAVYRLETSDTNRQIW